MSQSHVLAIFGVDGSGKSLLSKTIQKRNVVQTIICPRYHEHPHAPLRDLSETLNVMNQMGDDLGCFELKVIAVYLQLTLFFPVLKSLGSPGPLVSERHPLLDSLIYGPFFAKRIQSQLSDDFMQNRFIPALNLARPGGYALMMDWVQRENQRMGRDLEFKNFPLYLKQVFSESPFDLLENLKPHYQIELPNQAVFLDIELDLALEYIEQRSAYKESHENKEGLTRLRDGYRQIFQFLTKVSQQMKLTVIHPQKGQSIDELADQVLALIPGL